jgi:hypothetical protein
MNISGTSFLVGFSTTASGAFLFSTEYEKKMVGIISGVAILGMNYWKPEMESEENSYRKIATLSFITGALLGSLVRGNF